MTALVSLSDAVNKASGGSSGTPEFTWFFKDSRVGAVAASATIAGRLTSLWQMNGYPTGGGSAPGGTARNPTRSTNGAFGQANPGGGRQKFILSGSYLPTGISSMIVADRLADISGLSGTTTTAQNTTSLSVSRFTGTSAVGNMIAVEIYTQIGASVTTITATYTNQAGTGSQVTIAQVFGGTGAREAQRFIILPLAAGDTGVRSVESVTVLATTGTAGDFGVTIFRPLYNMQSSIVAVGTIRSFLAADLPMPEVVTDAALFGILLANGSTAPQIYGHIGCIES